MDQSQALIKSIVDVCCCCRLLTIPSAECDCFVKENEEIQKKEWSKNSRD